MIIKLHKSYDKQKILKVAKGKKHIIQNKKQREWSNVFKELKGKIRLPRILHSEKVFKNKDKKLFLDIKKLKEFITIRPSLQVL